QSGFDPVEDERQIPAQMPVAPVRRVMKPMRFLKQQFARLDSDQKDAPAARAKINCDVQRFVHRGMGSGEWEVGNGVWGRKRVLETRLSFPIPHSLHPTPHSNDSGGNV